MTSQRDNRTSAQKEWDDRNDAISPVWADIKDCARYNAISAQRPEDPNRLPIDPSCQKPRSNYEFLINRGE